MHKFFVSSNRITDKQIRILGEDVKHIVNVLRLNLGEKLNICNKETGENFVSKIKEINKESILCEIIERIKLKEKSNVEITVFQGLPKADKMELIIQKCTELGVKEITPVQMERCVVKLDSKSEIKKIERWQKIAEAASKQSKRNNICKINSITNIKNICNTINNYDILLVPYEEEKNNSFKDILQSCKQNNIKVAIVIGPEGGFALEEISKLKESGAKIITLGDRILRTETVAMTMAGIIMYEFDELG